jgi:hypothetical protein
MAVMLGLAFIAGLAVTKLFLISGNTNLALARGGESFIREGRGEARPLRARGPS